MNFSLISKILNKKTTSILVYKEENVINKINHWNKYLPFIKPYYAIKSNNHNLLLNTLGKFNVGYDVASKNEIKQVLKYEKPIIYSHPIKEVEDIKFAKKQNINYIVVDNEYELLKVKENYPDAKILLRIKSYEKYSTIKFNNKFGSNIEESKYLLKKYDFIYGISYHVGSKCENMKSHLRTLEFIYEFCLNQNSNIKLVDIGGGFTNEDDIVNLKNICNNIFSMLKNRNIEIIAEPGRYISYSSMDLYTRIFGIRYNSETNIYNIYINDSIYNTFSGKVFDHQTFKPIPLYKNDEMVECIIWGNTCDGEDLIVDKVLLPKPKINDILLWENMGSYSIVSAVDGFNGFSKSEVYA